MPYAVPPPEPPAIISHLSAVSSKAPISDNTQLTDDRSLLLRSQSSVVGSNAPIGDNTQLTDDRSLLLRSQSSVVGSNAPIGDNAQLINDLLWAVSSEVLTADKQELTAATPVLSTAGDRNTAAAKEEPAPDPTAETAKSAALLGSPLSVVMPSDEVEEFATTGNIVPEVAQNQEWGSQSLPGKEMAPTDLSSDVAIIDEILIAGESEKSAGLATKEGELSYFTVRDTELVQTPNPSRSIEIDPEPVFSPNPEAEILPTGHIGTSSGNIRNRRQNQRQQSQRRQSQGRQQQAPATGTPVNIPPTVGVIELFADRLEYDAARQIFTGVGNVEMRYQGGVLTADRVQGNLVNRVAVAEGSAAFRRGQQNLRGQRIVYNFVQDSGNIRNGSGEIFLPTSGTDLAFNLPNTGVVPPVVAERPLSDRLLGSQAPQQVTSVGGINLVFGGTRPGSGLPSAGRGGEVRRIRFEAENIDFYPRGYRARNVRLTNDPFSPPELEVRADQAIVTQVSPLRDEVALTRPRLVFDQGFALPIPRSRYAFDRTESEPPIFQVGYDERERGGVYIYRGFEVYRSSKVRFSVTPQFFIQRAISEGFGNPAELFGVRARFSATVGPRTLVGSSVTVNNFGSEGIAEKIRANTRLVQVIGTRWPHRLTLEYSFRDELFNGSLGYQTVQQAIGGVLTSPVFPLAKTGANLTYQVGAQYINADTDRLELLAPVRTNNRTSLGRYQASVSINRGIRLWRGQALPATASQGLRYTPVPVIPFVSLVPSVTSTTSLYSNGETQSTFTGSIVLLGQFGHFSKPVLDYTGFNLRLTRVLRNGESPFFFDRVVDERVLSFGVTQQLYGPFRIGFQTAINLDTNKSISTDYFLEYSRRTYGITLRYNPDVQLGAILLRISDFNWNNGGQPFGGTGVRFVDFGVLQDY
ncbi:DUF3769 domain-containing protein [Aerosakkonema funiforme]|uniref:DUF3769 domain-containing protein n=1 Tax=Aerosakkonema funiforme FACHB-1375 TaxID=2949571 RepID=A0A926ZJK0_9CYAN|nr:DUF3769 domain-containing protein [Aerosakkonema funiforme]MBD2185648.1 DUF3769 domain-containing protein [Aerosakkonema funiforme FACHB-1375]